MIYSLEGTIICSLKRTNWENCYYPPCNRPFPCSTVLPDRVILRTVTRMNGDDPLSDLAEVYHSLSASRRCHVIRILANSDDSELSVRTLSRKIAAIEEGVSTEHATGEPYRNVYNALSQTHLSTLSEAGIIIYDSNRQTVGPGPRLDTALLFLVLNEATYETLQEKFDT